MQRLSDGAADVSTWSAAAERFQSLRAQYAADPDALRPHVPQLAELRTRYEALLDADRPPAVDRYHELGEQIRRAEAEREYLRQFFIRRSRAGVRELTGTTAGVTVNARVGLAIPKAGTDARKRLDELLRASGRREEVSQLAASRSLRALQDRRFAPDAQSATERLCPRMTTHTVISRPRGKAPASA